MARNTAEDGEVETEKHEVTALEPAWVQGRFRPKVREGEAGKDVVPDYKADSTEVKDAIDDLQHDAEYSCSCGAELDNWDDVQVHFSEVGQEAENAVTGVSTDV
jgi:hypothetical protein